MESLDTEDTSHLVARVRDMGAVLHEPVHVSPDDPLETALTHMLTRDFSQLPVYSSPTSLKGVVSWRTIGTRKVLSASRELVQDFMEVPTTIDIDRPVLEAVDLVAAHDYVVVTEKRRVKAILTASDFSLQFKALSAPFLLIGEVEHGLRILLGPILRSWDQALLVTGERRQVADASELTFGEYVLLLQKPEVWARLGLALDRKVFIARLEQIRRIRNKVMHFRPGGLAGSELECLEAFARFMRRLREIPPRVEA